jgi:hypothetical protein
MPRKKKEKDPGFYFFVNDWYGDVELHKATPQTRGIWVDFLCLMHNQKHDRGTLTGPKWQLAQFAHCSIEELDEFIREAKLYKFCDVHEPEGVTKAGHVTGSSRNCHENVTIINRRMARESRQRDRWRKRKQAERDRKLRGDVTENVTADLPNPTLSNTDISKDISSSPQADEAPPKTLTPPCPQKQIISAYHEILPALPKIKTWPESAQKALRMRWAEDPVRQQTEWWREFFQWIDLSDFLMGRKTDWCTDLQWIVKAENFAKIINGRYHRSKNTTAGLVEWLKKKKGG